MNLTLKATGYELTDAMRALVERKLARIGKLLGAKKETALVAIEIGRAEHHRTGDIYRVEANLDTDGKLYRATAEAATFEAAVDKVESELFHELRKARGRARSFYRRAGVLVKSWLRSSYPGG